MQAMLGKVLDAIESYRSDILEFAKELVMPPIPCLDDGILVQHLHFLVSVVSTNRVLNVLVVVLATSNVHFGWTYHQSRVDRTNALGLVLMQATGPLSESVHILNKTIAGGQIDLHCDTCAAVYLVREGIGIFLTSDLPRHDLAIICRA